MRRFSVRDDDDLRWYFSGGFAADAYPPSSHEAMVLAMSRGGFRGAGGASPSTEVPEDLLKAAGRHRKIARRLETVGGRNPLAREVLQVVYSTPALPVIDDSPAMKALRELGHFAPALAVAPMARRAYQASGMKTPFWSWIIGLKMRSDDDTAALLRGFMTEVDSLVRIAMQAWEAA